ncbi:MAG: excinuclease ABC subunit UvrC [Magnetococcales bacterium]|nr:excinuclease ABC subunit UvrC [Magnetococcales bacterium]
MTIENSRGVISHLPETPGCYRFMDRQGGTLYVGKARNLQRRVASYFHRGDHPPRILNMLELAHALDYTMTRSDNEALLLEANLIKTLKPRFNILLRDDKSYPYIHLSAHSRFPRLSLRRGLPAEGGFLFGPYPSSVTVRETLRWFQSLYPVRQCTDQQFNSRKRPCLQYQIKRCSGPCCDMVEEKTYRSWVEDIRRFLQGGGRSLLQQLEQAMKEASETCRFEEAALLRDRLKALRLVQEKQSIDFRRETDFDVICLLQEGVTTAVQVMVVRGGLNLGTRGYFPDNSADQGPADVLHAFIAQFYLDKEPPPIILVEPDPSQRKWLEEALGEKRRGRVDITVPQRGPRRRAMEMALDNTRNQLALRIDSDESRARLLDALSEALGVERKIRSIEAYDISHFQGAEPVGSRVYFSHQGFQKGRYRKYTLRNPLLQDDAKRMHEILARRFRGGEENREENPWPDLVLVDGGLAQLGAAVQALEECDLHTMPLCAMAKGEERNAGRERLFLPGRKDPLVLAERSPVLFLLQTIRDEAHRFAVGFHRNRRDRHLMESILDRIPGMGPRRKMALLRHFGSVAEIRAAAVEDIAQIAGFPKALAAEVHRYLHQEINVLSEDDSECSGTSPIS